MKIGYSFKILHFKEMNSTQKFAHEYIKNNDTCDGTVIISETQSQGIGRMNRNWASPLGGLWMSIIIQKKIPIKLLNGFSIKLGLNLISKLEQINGLQFKLRWPNDLMLFDKKVGGILVDFSSSNNFLKNMIIGIGINVNVKIEDLPIDIQASATSISNELCKNFQIEIIKDFILNSISELLSQIKAKNYFNFKTEWAEKSFTYNKHVKIITSTKTIEGLDVGITDAGELIIKTKNKEEVINDSDIKLFRIVD